MAKQLEPLDLDALRPADTPAYMTGAWLGCIEFALSAPYVLAAFRAETGNQWTPASDGLGRMIDQAAGFDRDFLVQFIQWVNVNVWGPMDGPDET